MDAHFVTHNFNAQFVIETYCVIDWARIGTLSSLVDVYLSATIQGLWFACRCLVTCYEQTLNHTVNVSTIQWTDPIL